MANLSMKIEAAIRIFFFQKSFKRLTTSEAGEGMEIYCWPKRQIVQSFESNLSNVLKCNVCVPFGPPTPTPKDVQPTERRARIWKCGNAKKWFQNVWYSLAYKGNGGKSLNIYQYCLIEWTTVHQSNEFYATITKNVTHL